MNRRGFTLIEMLLALAVLAIGLVTVFALLPGAAGYSRDLRDRERMRMFADSVFASAEWALAERPWAPLLDPVPWTLPTVVGDHELEVGFEPRDEPGLWPADTSSLGEAVPMLRYRLVLDTNRVDTFEVNLRVWTQGMAESDAMEFTRRVPKGGDPW